MPHLRKPAKSVLKLIIATYLLVAMGVFSWLPVLVLHADQAHRAIAEDSGNVVSWTVHHVMDSLHGQSALVEPSEQYYYERIPHETLLHETLLYEKILHDEAPDHLLKLPSDGFIKYMLKVALQFEMITVMSVLILLGAFFALLRQIIPRCIGILPLFDIPIRNSIAVLTRTVVLRH